MSSDKIEEIKKRHEKLDAWLRWTRGASDEHSDRGFLLTEVEQLQTAIAIDNKILDEVVRERDEARAEARMLRAERDTLLLDSREFVRWFNAHYPDPSKHPDHPWGRINDRLDAHADTLAAIDAMLLAEIEATLAAIDAAGLVLVEKEDGR